MVDNIPQAELAEDADDCKERRCLKCRATFSSTWAGERVCPKCKTRATWHTGSNWLPGAF